MSHQMKLNPGNDYFVRYPAGLSSPAESPQIFQPGFMTANKSSVRAEYPKDAYKKTEAKKIIQDDLPKVIKEEENIIKVDRSDEGIYIALPSSVINGQYVEYDNLNGEAALELLKMFVGSRSKHETIPDKEGLQSHPDLQEHIDADTNKTE